MTRVVSLTDLVPQPRYDSVPWASVHVQEAPAPGGPWTQIDALALPAPLDVDPSNPGPRSVTTGLAALTTGWYRLVFLDASSGTSEPSQAVRSSIDSDVPPQPMDVRQLSPLLRAKFPLPPIDPLWASDLRNITYQATALVQSLTWRLIDPTLGDLAPEDYSSEALLDGQEPIAAQAIARMAERIYVTTEPDFAEQLATGRRLRGFSAGPYSESYFAPGEFARRGAAQSRPTVDPDDSLDTALWALMTEDARDYFVWRATGQALPAGAAVSFDYRREHLGYGAGGLGGWPARGGPDGW